MGIAITISFPQRTAPLWTVWAPVAIGLATTAGVVIVYGVRRWVELNAARPTRFKDVGRPVLSIVLFGMIVPNVTAFQAGPAHGNWRDGILVDWTVVASIPLIATIYGIRYVAGTPPMGQSKGDRLDFLLSLRLLLQRSLSVGGALLALVTLQAGALISLERSVHSVYGERPDQYILVFGGFGSLLVALIYVPAWATLQRSARTLCREFFPTDQANTSSDILETIDNRRRLEHILGADQTALSDLQSGVVIVSPLIAAAAAAFLPH